MNPDSGRVWGCLGLFGAVWGCSCLLLPVLGCFGLFLACFGLFWAVLACFGLFWGSSGANLGLFRGCRRSDRGCRAGPGWLGHYGLVLPALDGLCWLTPVQTGLTARAEDPCLAEERQRPFPTGLILRPDLAPSMTGGR